ncbi:putative nuclease HARBI1 [Lingula anatina]|uniref:Putative nuclease HARBI1 n=1 Tax=Lingula anatina TaxID=7574 RepID=A0A2R2MN13_LINAN|nr:putative nuclease HARBI1 [Lingula anatina]|eukprot:XP_023931601.1 putative nuclease HARBI1 [Lingula anatina]
MAVVWLNRIENNNRLQHVGGQVRREYNFDYEKYTDEEFRRRYRLTKDAFQELLRLVTPMIAPHNERGNPIPADIQLLLTLRFYATGTFQMACGDLCDISQSSASRIIKRVSEGIASLKPQFIRFPEGQELQNMKLGFWRIAGFPGVVGAIDCTHIKIPSPGGVDAELYRNRKGYFSINVQAVCGYNLEMLHIVARWPGSVHDARIFDNSRLCAQLERGDIEGILLGDGGYACRPYMMTPIINPLTRPERCYNASQIRTRNTVERMFGTWKRSFPCLSMSLRTKLQTTLTIIIATATLYNFVRARNDPMDEPPPQNAPNQVVAQFPVPARGLGNAARRTIIQQHFS